MSTSDLLMYGVSPSWVKSIVDDEVNEATKSFPTPAPFTPVTPSAPPAPTPLTPSAPPPPPTSLVTPSAPPAQPTPTPPPPRRRRARVTPTAQIASWSPDKQPNSTWKTVGALLTLLSGVGFNNIGQLTGLDQVLSQAAVTTTSKLQALAALPGIFASSARLSLGLTGAAQSSLRQTLDAEVLERVDAYVSTNGVPLRERLTAAAASFDEDKDGKLTIREVAKLLEKNGFDDSVDAAQIVVQLGLHEGTPITIEEFVDYAIKSAAAPKVGNLSWLMHIKPTAVATEPPPPPRVNEYVNEEDEQLLKQIMDDEEAIAEIESLRDVFLRVAFKARGPDGKGTVGVKELKPFEPHLSEADISDVIRRQDKDNDGRLNFDEFAADPINERFMELYLDKKWLKLSADNNNKVTRAVIRQHGINVDMTEQELKEAFPEWETAPGVYQDETQIVAQRYDFMKIGRQTWRYALKTTSSSSSSS